MLLELAVDFSKVECIDSLKSFLNGLPEISSFDINLSDDVLLVETTASPTKLLKIIQSAGYTAKFCGASSSASGMKNCDFGSGVANIIANDTVYGICRLFQPTDDKLLVDAAVSNLPPERKFLLAVHRFGDLSKGADSCGDVFDQPPLSSGELGILNSDTGGRGELFAENTNLKLWDLIGRAVVLHDVGTRSPVACGIVARSAAVRSNRKRVCTCSGLTIWEEGGGGFVH
ncbi:unnamed protein product [Dicrocoelium dendriticum]|nr:unnamed protein product [Dicrocoelium dendriticum]